MESLPEMTHAQLLEYQGENEANGFKTYLALKGDVFDVSSADFYKPGGPYHVFAGHDASVGLAKMSKEPEMLDKHDWKISLSAEELAILDNWHKRLSDKYQKVATLTH